MTARHQDIRVLIVEDHPIMRDGLRSRLETEPGIRIADEAGSGEAALKAIGRKTPDVAIMDIGLPDMSGIEVTREIKARFPRVRVVALTVRADSDTIREMLQAGASGFLSKETFCQELITAVRCVMKGEIYLSKDMAQVLYGSMAKGKAGDPTGLPSVRPTQRQREVLRFIQEGLSTKEIASRLGVSPTTVAMHRGRLMKRLGITSVANLVRYAISHPV